MAMNESSNLLLSAVHYPRHTDQTHHSNFRTDTVVHGLDSLQSIDRRASSVQSLQTISISQTPSISTSYPRLQHYLPRQASSPTPPATSNTALSYPSYKTAPLYSNFPHIDHYSPRKFSLSKMRGQDDNGHFINIKSSDECIAAAAAGVQHSKETATVAAETLPIEKNFLKTKPIDIYVRCIFSRVGEIDTLNERFTAEIFLEASWYDEEHKIGSKYDPQLGHFNPQLVVLNHMGDTLRHEKWYSMSKTNDSSLLEITEHHKIRGVFWERMELNHFPYDVQELSLSITTPLTTNDIKFRENQHKLSGVNRTVFSDEQSWHLYEHVEITYEEHREEYSLNFNQIHPVVVCTCHVGRKCGYYIWNAYFLIFLITSASLCTFAIPPSNTHGRLQITCTLLLTSVTFRWVVNKSLPTISYLTALDVYAISSIVALCIINVFHGIISYIYYNQIYDAASQTPTTTNALHLSLYPEYSLCRLDRYAFFIFLSLFVLYQAFILLFTIWIPYNRRRAMSQKDERIREQVKDKFSSELSK